MKRTPLPHGSKVGFCSLLAALLLLGSSTPASAASQGDLDLTGIVAVECDVLVTPNAGVADNLPLTSAQNLQVGTVNERCNDPDGYSLSADSANSSQLVALGTSNDTVPYSVTYGAAAVDLTSGPATVTDSNGPTPSSGVTKAVSIAYGDPGFIEADTYTDTITFTIAAK